MRWTAQDLADYMQKIEAQKDDTPDEGKESELQGKIVKYCKDHGFPCLSFRQSRKAQGFLTPGWPDLTILLPASRAIFIELKAKKGILKADQKNMALMMMALGHEWYEIRSYKRFLEVINHVRS